MAHNFFQVFKVQFEVLSQTVKHLYQACKLTTTSYPPVINSCSEPFLVLFLRHLG